MIMLPDELLLNNELFFSEVSRQLAQGRVVTLRAKGTSMFPFIADGRDKVVLRKTEEVRAGDIVLVNLPRNGYVLHRVYNIHGERLTLMGDGNIRATEHCQKADVLGKAIRICRNGRYVECDSFSEKFKASCWKRLLPLRRYLLFACRLMFTKK